MSPKLTDYRVTFRYSTGFPSHSTVISASTKEQAKEQALENAPFPESTLRELETEICGGGSCETVSLAE